MPIGYYFFVGRKIGVKKEQTKRKKNKVDAQVISKQRTEGKKSVRCAPSPREELLFLSNRNRLSLDKEPSTALLVPFR